MKKITSITRCKQCGHILRSGNPNLCLHIERHCEALPSKLNEKLWLIPKNIQCTSSCGGTLRIKRESWLVGERDYSYLIIDKDIIHECDTCGTRAYSRVAALLHEVLLRKRPDEYVSVPIFRRGVSIPLDDSLRVKDLASSSYGARSLRPCPLCKKRVGPDHFVLYKRYPCSDCGRINTLEKRSMLYGTNRAEWKILRDAFYRDCKGCLCRKNECAILMANARVLEGTPAYFVDIRVHNFEKYDAEYLGTHSL